MFCKKNSLIKKKIYDFSDKKNKIKKRKKRKKKKKKLLFR